MNLEQLQRIVLGVIQQPLTPSEHMRRRTRDGKSIKKIVEKVIKPNDRLTSFERLEIYNRVYWFRILSSLAEDFPGLRAVIGQRQFDKVIATYLRDCPSESFTLRNLGSRLEGWIHKHPRYTTPRTRLALDMVRLEWADIDVFDSAEFPALSEKDLHNLGEDPRFVLQPYIRLLDLAYPVDELLLNIRENEEQENDIASNVVLERVQRATKRPRLPRAQKVYLAVHRQDNVNYFKRLDPEGFALLRALQEGKTLSQAIEVAVKWTNRPVDQVTGQLRDWFANWSSLGWFCKQTERQEQRR